MWVLWYTSTRHSDTLRPISGSRGRRETAKLVMVAPPPQAQAQPRKASMASSSSLDLAMASGVLLHCRALPQASIPGRGRGSNGKRSRNLALSASFSNGTCPPSFDPSSSCTAIGSKFWITGVWFEIIPRSWPPLSWRTDAERQRVECWVLVKVTVYEYDRVDPVLVSLKFF
jgi:hypothetical protein